MLNNNLLDRIPGRCHSNFRNIQLYPLFHWNKEDTIEWIEKKKKDMMKFRGITPDENEEEEQSDEEKTSDTDS